MAEYTAILLEVHYLPNIQYFSKFLLYNQVIVEAAENYSKGSFRNRAYIAGVNGPLMLSIPLKRGKNQQQPIQNTQISYDAPWQSHHWTSIKSAYGNAPYFDYYADELKPLFKIKTAGLFAWNLQLIKLLLDLMDFEASISLTSNYEKELDINTLDARNFIQAKASLQIEDPHFNQQKYAQVFEEKSGFLTNLSILDLLFCTGPQAQIILNQSIIK